MKKSLLFCLLFTLGLTQTNAQIVKVGIKAGANISNFNGSTDEIKTESILGFHGGLFLNIGLGNIVGIQPEALISTSGAKIKDVNGTTLKDYKLTYFSVPVMLKIKPVGPIYFEVGPQFGFKIGDNITDDTVIEEYKKLDLSAAAGLGLQIKGITIGARYIAGLSKVGDFQFNNMKPDFKNGIIQAGIGLRF